MRRSYLSGDIDVSPKNIAFTFQGLNNRRQDQINKIVGHPPIAPLDRVDGQPLEKGQPPYLVQRLDWHKWGKEEYEDIRLLDFGECFQQGEEPESLAQSSILRVPETLLSDSFDYRVDLWRTGLVVCMCRWCRILRQDLPILGIRDWWGDELWIDVLSPLPVFAIFIPRQLCTLRCSNDWICGPGNASRMGGSVDYHEG